MFVVIHTVRDLEWIISTLWFVSVGESIGFIPIMTSSVRWLSMCFANVNSFLEQGLVKCKGHIICLSLGIERERNFQQKKRENGTMSLVKGVWGVRPVLLLLQLAKQVLQCLIYVIISIRLHSTQRPSAIASSKFAPPVSTVSSQQQWW